MKSLKRTTFWSFMLGIIFFFSYYLLKLTDLSFRTWVIVIGKIIIMWVWPLMVVLWVGVGLKEKSVVHRIVNKIIMGVAITVYICWALFALLLLLFSIDEEDMVTSHLLVTTHSDFLGESECSYFRPVTLFFKKPCEVTANDKKEYLERKYDREFAINDSDEVYDVEFPELVIHIYFSDEGCDDLAEVITQYCLVEGMEKLGIDRTYKIYSRSLNFTSWTYLYMNGENDITEWSEDASQLMNFICDKTDFFQKNKGYLGFYSGEGRNETTGIIPFGKPDKYSDEEEGYYLYPEKVQEYVRADYQRYLDYQNRIEEYPVEDDSLIDDILNKDSEEEEKQEEIIDAREVNAKKVYDAVLAQQGYSYEVCYDTHDNLYLNLGERSAGMPEDESSTGTYSFRLVYDRPSKNGASELFVLYKEHYMEDENGMLTSDATVILDMYAVETDTGKVVASDKHSWSDLGNKEYRDLTGE